MNRLFRGDVEGPELLQRAFWMSFGLLFMAPVVVAVAHYEGTRRWLGVAALVVFTLMYYAATFVRWNWEDPFTVRSLAVQGAFALLAAGLPLLFGLDWLGLPIYLAFVLAMSLPLRWTVFGVLGSAAVIAGDGVLLGAPAPMIGGFALVLLAFGMMMVALRHARTLVAQLREARGEVARLAAADERLRIARDLHDLLGHSLSLIVLKSELARRLADRDPARAVTEIGDIESVARSSLADVREAISGYRRRDLGEELDGARAVLAAAGVDTTVRMAGVPLPEAADGVFGWVVRESVTNVIRHARASHCVVEVGRDGDEAVLEVRDNGRIKGKHVPGNGLNGLSERVAAEGGTMESGPLPGGGFRVVVRVPVGSAS
ncbi:sensor histidine kinase [Streptosporangium lutulentum]|uniref:Two-component system sensor histidine kinase DesK n=1 Tax=Streptosporangium lutulentum TaxID=1461250 RepID=A0ABT9QM87_9ACTN|nr:sensor histidine kinase [Streptosporangium lutulentum]MDP9847872.1 two-component system sensor histidine kinase DesK [Streptosporangium lutulentum]